MIECHGYNAVDEKISYDFLFNMISHSVKSCSSWIMGWNWSYLVPISDREITDVPPIERISRGPRGFGFS
jgi:hypothetical protein